MLPRATGWASSGQLFLQSLETWVNILKLPDVASDFLAALGRCNRGLDKTGQPIATIVVECTVKVRYDFQVLRLMVQQTWL